jgi:glutaredoxin
VSQTLVAHDVDSAAVADMVLTLFSKPGCHLCEDVRTLLDELQADYGFTIEEVDITSDADLSARYKHDIPVLLLDGTEIGRGMIGESAIVLALRRVT